MALYEAAAGDAMSIVNVLIAVVIGAWWIDRETPGVADLRDEL
jgi:hypothetical protein